MRRWGWCGALATVALVTVALMSSLPLAGLSHAARRPALVIHRVDEAHFTAAPGEPVFLLVIGSDERPGLDGARGDALHLIGVNPALAKATILDIPRDTYVEIPGRGRAKINDAFAVGGPALQARVVSDLVGVAVPFVLSTNFDGLTAMVDELGGVDVDVPIAMDDSFSGARFAPGRVHMDGRQALAFSRNRHIPDGDIRRTEDQGLLILAALAKLHADPGATATIRDLAVLLRHTRLEGLNLRDLYRLGRMALGFDPANVRNVVMPARPAMAGALSIVVPTPPAAGLFADLRDNAVLDTH